MADGRTAEYEDDYEYEEGGAGLVPARMLLLRQDGS
jgi:hypothetical protein